MKGKVIEVFIPPETKNGILIDSINSTKIGFKVKCAEKTIEIIQEQNFHNSNILKDDFVIITPRKINDKTLYDIKLCIGEQNDR